MGTVLLIAIFMAAPIAVLIHRRSIKKPEDGEIAGFCYRLSDQGSGPWWAFQDKRFIFRTKDRGEQWLDAGLHILENGDRLTIYDKRKPGKIVWRGRIWLLRRPGSQALEDRIGVQKSVNRKKWNEWFREGYPAGLIPTSARGGSASGGKPNPD